jgi:hypothetical protein
MIKKNRMMQVLKNHHIPNCIPSCASLQLFTLNEVLLEQANSSASASGGSNDAVKAYAALRVG